MIWIVAVIEALVIALCVSKIRELTSRINTSADMVCRIVALCEKMNDQLQETMTAAKVTGEGVVILNGKVSNNEHRIRDIYKAINQMKGWPTNGR
ncbi:MAG: hypothetical protein IJG17_06235 [Eubacterium sp.]|nr:hypothetical protein [Eubacterium sp.]